MTKHKYIALTKKQQAEIKLKWKTLTNDQLLNHLVENFNYQGSKTSMRIFMYDNKMKKTNMVRWLPKETKYLLDNYKTKGNIEIATKLSTKKRPFTKKNVEKKMRLLNIARTPDEIDYIRKNHIKKGVYSIANFKKWETRKIQEDETVIQIRAGRPTVMVKINEALIPYARHRYVQLYGETEQGMRVHFKDCNPLNVEDDNLELRKGCSYKGMDRVRYNRFCKEYVIKNKLQEIPTVKQTEQEAPTNKFQGLITVRINAKTVIQVKPGTNIEAIRERYGTQRMLSNAKS